METDGRSEARRINQLALIEYVRNNPNALRADAAKALRLSKPAVSDNVTALIERGILREQGFAAGAVGKRGACLAIDETRHQVLVVDTTSNIAGGWVTLSCFALSHRKLAEAAIEVDFNNLWDSLTRQIPVFLASGNYELRCVIVSASGIFHNGLEQAFEGRPFSYGDFAEELSTLLGVPVYNHNDVNLAAIGEFGPDKATANGSLAYLWADTALGAGFVLNGKPFQGSGGAAGELGYYKLAGGDYLKDVLALNSVLTKLETLSSVKPAAKGAGISARELAAHVERCLQASPACQTYLDKLSDIFATVAANVVTLLDVETCVLDGRVASMLPGAAARLRKMLAQMGLNKAKVRGPECTHPFILGGGIIGVQAAIEGLL